ncbi:hypothetical protein BIW11_12498 [Tropilaelaps mercedesae]|uniref:Uncharacterized protein n=1 Tax=Tropilaelaps mercedesae TaxID=418985 RepID=A0A1V9X642_9ACAR|nr:hypothetical protein BIW11_12498 [Tropilaelaps mercedesae]
MVDVEYLDWCEVDVKNLLKNFHIREVDSGRPCYDCGVKCAGFKPHQWRFVANARRFNADATLQRDNFVKLR